MGSYGSIDNTSPPGGGSGESDEERDSFRTPLVLPKGRRGMRRQPSSQVNTHLHTRLFPTSSSLLICVSIIDHSGPLTTTWADMTQPAMLNLQWGWYFLPVYKSRWGKISGKAGNGKAGGFTALSWGLYERLWHTGWLQHLAKGCKHGKKDFSFQSDTEFFGDARPITSNLPNAAPAPFVYLGFCCAVLAGLCFTSRSSRLLQMSFFLSTTSNLHQQCDGEICAWSQLVAAALCSLQYAGETLPSHGGVGQPGQHRRAWFLIRLKLWDSDVKVCFQLVTMLPLMFLSGQNIMGTPDLATRYVNNDWRVAPASSGGGWSRRESLAAFYSFPYLKRFPGHLWTGNDALYP